MPLISLIMAGSSPYCAPSAFLSCFFIDPVQLVPPCMFITWFKCWLAYANIDWMLIPWMLMIISLDDLKSSVYQRSQFIYSSVNHQAENNQVVHHTFVYPTCVCVCVFVFVSLSVFLWLSLSYFKKQQPRKLFPYVFVCFKESRNFSLFALGWFDRFHEVIEVNAICSGH